MGVQAVSFHGLVVDKHASDDSLSIREVLEGRRMMATC